MEKNISIIFVERTERQYAVLKIVGFEFPDKHINRDSNR